MKKLSLLSVGAFFIATTLTATAWATTTVRLAHGEADDHAYGKYALMFAHSVSALSKGSMECTVVSKAVLGTELELAQKVQQGTLHMALVTATNLGPLAPSANVVSLPYLFDSPEALMGTTGLLYPGSPLRDDLVHKVLRETSRIRILGIGTSGFRLLFVASRPVTSLGDLKGVKLRLPPSPVLKLLWEAWGAQVHTIPWAGALAAVQAGTVDAYESPLETLSKSGFYKYTKYVTQNMTHSAQSFFLLVNERWFQTLKPYQRQLLTNAAHQNDIAHFALIQQHLTKVKKDLIQNKDVTFHNLTDAPQWEAIAMKLWTEFYKICGGEEWVKTVAAYKNSRGRTVVLQSVPQGEQ